MRIKRMILILALIITLGVHLPVRAASSGADDIIRQLLLYYAHHQENAQTDILRLLDQLEAIDPEQAEDWRMIMDSWHLACSSLTVHSEVLPEGLPQDDTMCIVVMGFALNYNGTMSLELQGRLNTALACAEQYPNAFILCAGGGTAGGNATVTEAGQMAAWLKNQGIAPERIIVENRSFSTEQNVQYALSILRNDYPQVNALSIVSSDYHIRRCHWLFETEFILMGVEDQYRVVSNAAYAAGYVGESMYQAEVESLGNRLNLYTQYSTAPKLSQLSELVIEGRSEYLPGQCPDLTLTAFYDTGYSRDVTADAVLSGFDLTVPGASEIIATYTENGITRQAVLPVTVLQPPEETTLPQQTQPDPIQAEPLVPTGTTEPAQPLPSSGDAPYLAVIAAAAVILLTSVLLRRKRRGEYKK